MAELYPWQEYAVAQYETDLKPLFERFTVKFKALLEELSEDKPHYRTFLQYPSSFPSSDPF